MNGDGNGKLPDGELLPQSEFGKKLENFWYYHKWKVVAGIFVLFVLVICIVQCAMQDKNDVGILYGGALSSSDTRTQDMRKALSDTEPESIGKNGVGLSVMEIYTDEYVLDNKDKINASVNAQNHDNLCKLITAGEYSVLILDRWIYEGLKGKVGFRAVDEVLGEGAVSDEQKLDDCAVYLKKTAFFAANSGAYSGAGDDTVICLCIYSPVKSVAGCSGGTDRDYNSSVEMFKAIINYKSN